MSSKKILIVCLLFLMNYSNVGALSLFEKEKATSADTASYVKNIFNIALRETPGFEGKKIYLVMKGVGGEVIGKGKTIDGITWLPVRYTDSISGWVHSKLVAKEDYYVLASEYSTVFLRERISLAGTSQDICTTNTPVEASNILTTFRPETPVFTYTPTSTTSTQTGSVSTDYRENVLTTFRPETPVFTYTSSNTTSTQTGTTFTETNQNVLTSFRPETPLFKYIVNSIANSSVENPLIQTITSMILTTFRPETPVFTYTPSSSIKTQTGTSLTQTNQNVLTTFRPETPVFTYTPSNSIKTQTGTNLTQTNQNVLTTFRPETPVFTYTPSNVSYSCQSVN